MRVSHSRQSQKGTTLLVVLLLVLVSTLLGISAFEDSGVTAQLVNNDRQREVAFRAAESSSNQFVTSASVNTLMASGSATLTDTTGIITNATTSSSLRLDGVGLPRDYSMGEGVPGLAPYKFTSTTTVELNGVGAQATIVRGAEQLAPKL